MANIYPDSVLGMAYIYTHPFHQGLLVSHHQPVNQLKACAELGVDYADTSGESTFMRILEDVEVDKCFGRNENDTFLVKVIFVDMKLVTCEAFF